MFRKYLQWNIFLALMFGFFVVPGLVLGAQANGYFWICVLILSVGVIISMNQEEVTLFYYLTFFLFVFLGIYFIQTAVGIEFISGRDTVEQATAPVAIFIAIHVIGLVLGNFLANKKAKYFTIIKPKRFQLSSLVMILLFSGISLVVIITYIGHDTFLGLRVKKMDELAKAGGISHFIFFIGKLIPYVAVLFFVENLLQKSQRISAWILLLLLLVMAILISNPSNVARYICLTGLSLVAVHSMLMLGWDRAIQNFILISAPVILIILPATSLLRHGVEAVTWSRILASLSSLEFSSFQFLIDGLSFVSGSPAGGLYVLSSILVFIPRALWESKADSIFEAIAPKGNYVIDNVAITSAFSGYADFGFIGAFIVSVGIGMALGLARLDKGVGVHRRRYFYGLAVFCLVPILARGSFNSFFVAFYALAVAYEVLRFSSRLNLRRNV